MNVHYRHGGAAVREDLSKSALVPIVEMYFMMYASPPVGTRLKKSPVEQAESRDAFAVHRA